MASPGGRLLALWKRLLPLPGGRRLFSFMLGRQVPYSYSIRPLVVSLAPGHARVELSDRWGVRNHLGSVHAIALANLGELASGLAMMTALPPGVRGIVVRITMDYHKKARGLLVATGYAVVPSVIDAMEEHDFVAEITNADNEVVATATVRWRLAPEQGRVTARTAPLLAHDTPV
jgi:acyl-coenzyme A thioesterase PaaI-like protein